MSTVLYLLACSSHVNHLEVLGDPLPKTPGLVVAEPVYWEDHLEADPFHANAVVGNIVFSGGYITENDGRGMHNVSREVSVGQQERYREQVGLWLEEVLPATVVVEDPTPPQTREIRGTQDGKPGHDNASLPRVTFRPQPTGPLPQPTVVPWVVSYYSHNAGWFYGQEWGTAAGARIHVLLVAYDTDGSVLGHLDVDGGRVSERVFSPSEPQLQDFLIHLEKKVGGRLAKAVKR